MHKISKGDYIYFVDGDYEYEARVLGINADNIMLVEHADKDGNLCKRIFGGLYGKMPDITSVSRKKSS
ncbi:hypothetical protein CL634_08805 [bacterium]|nr:hypothetical protein [bacterium]|tara:strand:+ start:338 stop:541 length:204 start_codon:yes stop_codon:yes gene_type:complete